MNSLNPSQKHKGKKPKKKRKIQNIAQYTPKSKGNMTLTSFPTSDLEEKLYFIIMELSKYKFKDPNQFLSMLAQHFKTIELHKNILNPYLTSRNSELINQLESSVFSTLSKVMSMKLLPDVRVNIKKLQMLISEASKMNLLSSNKAESIMKEYQLFCKRPAKSESLTLSSNLPKASKLANNPVKNSSLKTKTELVYVPKGIPSSSKSSQEKLEQIYVPKYTPTSSKPIEETKCDINFQDNQEKAEQISVPKYIPTSSEPIEETKCNINFQDNMEMYCFFCMTNRREVLFYPCCHFLSCKICSEKLHKCPMCCKQIKKPLKVFWS